MGHFFPSLQSPSDDDDCDATVLEVAPHFQRLLGPGGALFLIGEHERLVIRDPLHSRLLMAIDGVRPLGSLLGALAPEFGHERLRAAVLDLTTSGYVGRAVPHLGPEVKAWWRGHGVAPARVAEALEAFSVRIEGLGRPVPGLGSILEEAGVRVAEDGACTLIVTDDYLGTPTRQRLTQLRADAQIFVPLRPFGRALWIGPIFAPGPGRACFDCLAHEIERNRPLETYLAEALGAPARPEAPAAALPVTVRLAACFAAVKLAEAALDPASSPLSQHLISFDLRSMEPRLHPVRRRPQCPTCGDAGWMKRSIAAPIALAPVSALPDQEGGRRSRTAEDTWRRCAHLISPLTGALAGLSPHEKRNHPRRPNYVAGYHVRPTAGQLADDETFFRPAFGKGRSPAQARASALAEGIERYASLFQGDEPLVRAAFADLAPAAVHPRTLLRFSERQYAEAHQAKPASAGNDPRHTAPAALPDDLAIDWVPCWSLSANARRYLPASFCFNQAPQSTGAAFCRFDPNGHAAGTCREEAILQGFLELVERDAVGIWWYNRLLKPGVTAAGPRGEFLAQMREHYRALGWHLWALDLTTDLGIPVIAAIARGPGERYLAGFGCHLDATLALERAVSEVNQVFEPANEGHALFTANELPHPAFIHPHPELSPRTLTEPAPSFPISIDAEVELCVERARAGGLETIVLDYTRPDLVLSTVKVVVPGLRHFWRRLGPGRLYDVPVALGERDRPLAEDALNPYTLKV